MPHKLKYLTYDTFYYILIVSIISNTYFIFNNANIYVYVEIHISRYLRKHLRKQQTHVEYNFNKKIRNHCQK